MIPGGRIQDKAGPKVGAITGGLFLAVGCIIAGLMKSYAGLIFGFGILGGIGMGIGYAAPTPAALSWFGPHKRGLIAGLVVGGYGGAALYIGPPGFLSDRHRRCDLQLDLPGHLLRGGGHHRRLPAGQGASGLCGPGGSGQGGRSPGQGGGHHHRLVPVGNRQDLAVLSPWSSCSSAPPSRVCWSSATPPRILATAAKGIPFLMANAWILVSCGGLINALGRVGTGMYSDKIGRDNAYTINCLVSALCLFLLPTIIASGNIFLLFVAVGIAYWQYGGGLALMPAYTADFFGPKNLGMNYGLVFIGWGLGFFMTRLGRYH